MFFVQSAWSVARIQVKLLTDRTFFPLLLKLRESEIWDIALRAKSLTLGRIQTSLVLLSLIWDIRGLFSLIIMYTFKIKDYNDNKNN